ncbi:MAG: lipoate--protein ligase family protein [Nitrospirae bacterium]|nr:lipoate--protein ligase family protein [Nitrospirota bacterium]
MSEWRIIDSGDGDAFYNMALDEAISASVRKGNAPPTLRFYGWAKPSLSIGCFQGTKDIDSDYCKEKDIPIVRRPTGGRAILHDKELTYSFSSRSVGVFSDGLRDTYKKISSALSIAMERLGIQSEMQDSFSGSYARSPLCFQSSSYGELSFNGRKLIGSAQRRWNDGFLQQGSIPYRIDYAKIKRIFPNTTLHRRQEIPLIQLYKPDNVTTLKDAIRESFEMLFDVKFIRSNPIQKEEVSAQELLSEKYLVHEWNYQR